MPTPSVLNPVVLNGVIQELLYPDTFLGLAQLGTPTPNPWPVARWDVVASSREVGEPTVPNTEAKAVQPLKKGTREAGLIYVRHKKVFKPTTIHWLRTPGELAMKNAERAVMEEVQDLDRLVTATCERYFWAMLAGEIVLDSDEIKTTISFGLKATHKPTVTTAWSVHATADVLGDFLTWRRLADTDGAGARLTRAFANGTVIDDVLQNADIQGLFS